ncbi:L-xylulose reductase isoform X1 [Lingula anatina]|uniref:L-xylulose reductase isoform X1 n=1 Tax=Lingula anatina TaxID=7574 RepID=A0A1S3HWU1_LINAN|nr:L-xylulose reductase isoform X1 [Lingula anatina]|eukprot:XP_013390500.1 L-xylulose reductase isoform X1 [Lingula anatina]
MDTSVQFNGKKALVTGAGKGLGRDLVKVLAKCGAEVCALSKTQADLDSLKEEVPGVRTVCVDISDWKATRKAVQEAGHFDLLINNAAVSFVLPFLEVTEENLSMHLDVNLKAMFNISQVVAKSMIDKGTGGSIVNVSSVASHCALLDHSVYCSIKAAVDMLTKCMCLELGKYKVI